MKLEEYPESITKNRQMVEASFIFSLYKNPSLYEDYHKNLKIDLEDSDIRTDDGIFYYSLGLQMFKLGYQTFDSLSAYAFLESNQVLKDGFESRGGYKSVEEMKSLINLENLDKYYDELVKCNMLLRLYDKGFNVENNIDKFTKMSSDEVYAFYDYQLNNIALNKSVQANIADLNENYDEWIDKWDQGNSMGYKMGFPLINYHMAGVHKGNLILHVGGIGQGKSTSAILFYVLPTIESGESIVIIGNEQDEDAWRQMILSSVLFNKIHYRKMNRQKFMFGGFSDEDKEGLQKATEWLKKSKGKIYFAHLQDYNINTVKKIIKKYSKRGVGVYLFDTMKPEDDSSDKAWAQFSEVAKELFLIAHKEDIALIATAQLSGESNKRKYLDLSCIGKSKAIAETAGQVLMFRPVRNEEKEKMKGYSYKKNNEGKYTNIKIVIDLSPDKDYIIVFVSKNRYGKANICILYERNMDFNSIIELGYVDVEFDGWGR